MNSETVETVTEWDSASFTGGYTGLRDLADREFTGAVTEGTAWLFMLNGRVVGVCEGTIEAFEDADGTAYTAPHPSLPLLFAMREQGGETRAKYYTEDTALSEADETLRSGNFTGYVELSENVLSGDYYVVYQGGKSMSAAFVGNNRRVVTGDEAFEKADDEVGIYEVKTVDLDVVDIPEPTGEAEPEDESTGVEAGSAAVTSTAAESETADESAEPAPTETDESPEAGTDEREPGATATASPAADDSEETPQSDSPSADATSEESQSAASGEESQSVAAESEVDADGDVGSEAATAETPAESDSTAPGASTSTAASTDASAGQQEPSTPAEQAKIAKESVDEDEGAADASTSTDDVFSEEAQWRQTKTIPALAPDRSVDVASANQSTTAASARTDGQSSRKQASRDGSSSASTRRSAQQSTSADRLASLESELEDLRETRDELAEERDRLAEERDELERERDAAQRRATELESQVDELESQIDRLEEELASAREGASGGPDGQQLGTEEAIAGTNVFVRYRSKSGATLTDAHEGDVDRDEVNENLRLEHHTGFEDANAVVDGESYEAFLHDTLEYGFGRWLIEDLLYEIRETGNRAELQDLYDAIPDIDRIEFRGEVTHEADAESESITGTFDVVVRDRMGNPLVVADFNDSRDAASESMLESLLEQATPIAEETGSIAAAFFVTTSFFQPGALEMADDATGGGLLRREKRKSFVKLSRKQGFHLCLVETRNGEFHVNVPEL